MKPLSVVKACLILHLAISEKCTASQKQEYLIQGSSGQDIILGHGLEVNSTVEIAWEFVTKDGKELVVAKANRQNVKVYTKFLDRVIVNNTHFLLTIKNLTYQDTGTYIGRLTYESGEIQSVSYKISIRVLAKPELQPRLNNATTTSCSISVTCSLKNVTSNITCLYQQNTVVCDKPDIQSQNNGRQEIHLEFTVSEDNTTLVCNISNEDSWGWNGILFEDVCQLDKNENSNYQILLCIMAFAVLIIIILAIMKAVSKKICQEQIIQNEVKEEVPGIQMTEVNSEITTVYDTVKNYSKHPDINDEPSSSLDSPTSISLYATVQRPQHITNMSESANNKFNK
ncbi:uncharacterized protein LOC114666914 isoform X1 [Erpetoichthys calabaricus]|uniref:uncharacterized protein LOC114666914 isoform X1 n=1 Tax=Erpetoichthys calabaricus TaxID=27687 RepID=UPI0010A037C3|nr:uncharacterized protein LOC114666914 isoform X1 [Erpetoichthys calabaricus]